MKTHCRLACETCSPKLGTYVQNINWESDIFLGIDLHRFQLVWELQYINYLLFAFTCTYAQYTSLKVYNVWPFLVNVTCFACSGICLSIFKLLLFHALMQYCNYIVNKSKATWITYLIDLYKYKVQINAGTWIDNRGFHILYAWVHLSTKVLNF